MSWVYWGIVGGLLSLVVTMLGCFMVVYKTGGQEVKPFDSHSVSHQRAA